MTDSTTFLTTSPRFSLPLLFAGQSQKEVTVNEALLMSDILLHPVVQGVASVVPGAPTIGECWLVATGATSAFAGHDHSLAAWTDGGWRFAQPTMGLKVFDVSLNCYRTWTGTWRITSRPSAPTGGAVVDVQARAALSALITVLEDAAIISTT